MNAPGIEGDTPEGAKLRAEVGQKLVEANEKAWHPIGIHLSHVYFPSPIVVDDGTPPVGEGQGEYVPTAQPGARAPHVWLVEGEKTILDYFGPGFTLLKFAGGDTGAFESAAATSGLPLAVVAIDNKEARALYEKKYVLVRPDGHVAWRADELPPDCRWLVDRVRGSVSMTAARWRTPGMRELVS